MRLLKEDDVAFHLAHDDGRTAIVPKRGLHRNVQEHLRTIPKAENFCHGGTVRGYSDGGPVPPDPSLVLTGDPATDAIIQGVSPGDYPNRDPGALRLGGAGTVPVDVNRQTGLPVDAPGQPHGLEQAPPMPTAPQAPPAPSAPVAGYTLPDLSALNPGAAPLSYAQNTVVPEQKAAAQAQADVEARTAKAQMEAKQAEQDHIASGAQARDDYLRSRMDEYRKLRDDFMNDKVNPRQFWESRSGGDKALSLIGIILGGMGAGLTGGPNHALGVVEKLIEQDIDAQKANIAKKHTLLGMHLEETRDMGQAMRETMIDKLGAFRAQFEKAALQFGGDRAQANAKAALAQIDASLLPLIQQSAQWKSQMAMKQWEIQAYGQMGQGGGQGFIPGGSPPTMPKSLFDPGARSEAMQRDAERRVELGGGRFTHAHDPAGAQKVREVMAGAEGAMRTLQALKEHVAKVGFDESARRAVLQSGLATDLSRAQGEGGSGESVKRWEALIPGYLSTGKAGKLGELEHLIRLNQVRMLQTYVGGDAARLFTKSATVK